MAQAFFEELAPADMHAESAGQEPRREGVWPNVIQAMRDIGIDLAARSPQKLTVEMQLHADWGVTLACGARCPYVPTTVEDWDVQDPGGLSLEETRAIRDEIEVRVTDLVENRLDEIRADRTAHERRLASLLPSLAEEFSGQHSDTEIRACADAVLSEYRDVRVRSYILPLALRRTRVCLAAPVCELISTG
jgi:arsenate reductase